jgi:hypothetical protein
VKYICKKDCYVRNPQGKFQHFKVGATVDYAAAAEVPEHFEAVGGVKSKVTEKKAAVRGRKKTVGVK